MNADLLQRRVLALMAGSTADSFERLALDVFAFQFENCAVYRAYCEHQQRTPATVDHWTRIPAVPTSAFKDFALTTFPVEQAVAEFHTSGTTRGQSGRHFFATTDVYDAAARRSFREHLLPDDAQLPMLALLPSPAEAPHSSLSHMIGVVGGEDVEFFVDRGALLMEKLTQRLCEAQWDSQPVMVLGTAFAFVHFFDTHPTFQLPEGSRAMETGGFKGRSREVSKRELHAMFERCLGVPGFRVVNEYGMTELSTQFYDESFVRGRASDGKREPPWARVQIIDPVSGTEAAMGQPGMIRVFDLANIGSAACVQTEDLGVRHEDGGFEVRGRMAGAEVRGCSLNAESLSLT